MKQHIPYVSPHNNIMTKLHIKSFSQQTKLVLNRFWIRRPLVYLAPFHLRSTYVVSYSNC